MCTKPTTTEPGTTWATSSAWPASLAEAATKPRAGSEPLQAPDETFLGAFGSDFIEWNVVGGLQTGQRERSSGLGISPSQTSAEDFLSPSAFRSEKSVFSFGIEVSPETSLLHPGKRRSPDRRLYQFVPYQFVIDPSGRKYVCARLVSYFVTSRICVSLLMSSSTPSPGRSLG